MINGLSRQFRWRWLGIALLLVLFLPSGAYAGGLTLNGSEADKTTFRDLLKRCKAKSKSFKLLLEGGLNVVGRDAPMPGLDTPGSPITITINLGHTGSYIDDASGGSSTVNVNLDNLNKLPEPDIDKSGAKNMPAGYPKWGLTRCEDLAHFLSEAFKNTKAGLMDVSAHQFGRTVQNMVRLDFGLVNTERALLLDNYYPGQETYKKLTYLETDPKKPTGDVVYLGITYGQGSQIFWFHDGKMETWFYGTGGVGSKPLGPITTLTLPPPAQAPAAPAGAGATGAAGTNAPAKGASGSSTGQGTPGTTVTPVTPQSTGGSQGTPGTTVTPVTPQSTGGSQGSQGTPGTTVTPVTPQSTGGNQGTPGTTVTPVTPVAPQPSGTGMVVPGTDDSGPGVGYGFAPGPYEGWSDRPRGAGGWGGYPDFYSRGGRAAH